MEKSADAFRTISEVAEVLETPAHVLRFWESRFPQIRPVKRAGGRRYYRPADIALLSGIKRLLHDEGMTIRGVQKILREQGVRHVAGLTSTEDRSFDLADAIEDAEVVQPDFGFDEEVPRAVLAFKLPSADPEPTVASIDPVDDEAAGHAEMGLAFGAPSPIAEDPDTAGPEEEIHTDADPTPDELAEVEDFTAGELTAGDPDFVAASPLATEASPVHMPPTDFSDTPVEEQGVWLPALLRGLPPDALRSRRNAFAPLQARLVDLRERLASAHRGGRR